MNLILLEAHEVGGSGEVTLTGARAAHVLNVLRSAHGSSVRVGLVDGPLGIGIVDSTGDCTVTLCCAFEPGRPPRPRVDLLLALPRPKVLRRLWAQLAALGVGRIILTNAERVERQYFDAHVLEETRYRPLLIEGLQQARDTRLPLVSIHRKFKILVEDHLDALVAPVEPSARDGLALRLAADPSAQSAIDAIVRARHTARVLVAIGPEGGWNEFERTLLFRHGFEPAGMGARTLRSDTACVALLALAHGAMEADRREAPTSSQVVSG